MFALITAYLGALAGAMTAYWAVYAWSSYRVWKKERQIRDRYARLLVLLTKPIEDAKPVASNPEKPVN